MSTFDEFSNLDQQTVLLLQRLKQLNGEFSNESNNESNGSNASVGPSTDSNDASKNLNSIPFIQKETYMGQSKNTEPLMSTSLPKDASEHRFGGRNVNSIASSTRNNLGGPYGSTGPYGARNRNYNSSGLEATPKVTRDSDVPYARKPPQPSRIAESLSALQSSLKKVREAKEGGNDNDGNSHSNVIEDKSTFEYETVGTRQHEQNNQNNNDSHSDDEDIVVIDSTDQAEEENELRQSSTTPSKKSPLTRKTLSPLAESDRLTNYHQLKNLFSDKMKPPKEFIAVHKEALAKLNVLEDENRDLIRQIKRMEETFVEISENHERDAQAMEELKSKYRNNIDNLERMSKEKEQVLKNKLKDRDQHLLELEGKIVELQEKLVLQAMSDHVDESYVHEKEQIIKNLQESIKQLTDTVQSFKKENTHLQNLVQRKDIELEKQKLQVSSLNNSIETKDGDVAHLYSQLNEYKQKIDEYDDYTHSLREKTENSQNMIQKLNQEVTHLKESNNAYKEQIKELDDLRSEYSTLKNQFDDYVHTSQQQKKEKEESNYYAMQYRNIIDQKDMEIMALQNALQHVKKEKSRVEAQFSNYREKNKELQNDALMIHEKVQSMKNQYLEMVTQRDDLQSRLNELLKIRSDTAADSRIQSLESLLDSTTAQLTETKRELSQIKEDYLDLEAKHNQSRTLHTDLSTLKIKNSELEGSMLKYKSQYEEIFVKYAELQTLHADLEREYEEYKLNELSATDYGEELQKQNEMLQRELVEIRSRRQDEIDDIQRKSEHEHTKQMLIDEKITGLNIEISELQIEKQELHNQLNALNIEKNILKERSEKRENESLQQISYLNERIKDLKHQQVALRDEHSRTIAKLTDEKSTLETEIRKLRSEFQSERKAILSQEMELAEKEKATLRMKYQSEIAALQRSLSERDSEIIALKREVTNANRSRNEEIAEMRIQMRLLEHSNRYKEMYDEMKSEAPNKSTAQSPRRFRPSLSIQSSITPRSTPDGRSLRQSPYLNRSIGRSSINPFKLVRNNVNQTF